jgi:1-aminocyclopropane-1-carboxylate deaminase/D-cysteine desulfhydrase-like pyridoxal-dependent ACC family enzyme
MCFGVYDLLAKDAFEPDSTVVVLHTGGMQGWKGFQQRYGAAGTL